MTRVAVVGATGAVGSTMLDVLRRRELAVSEVVPFASERSVGRTIAHGPGEELTVQALTPESVRGFDLALFSAGSATSEAWAPAFAEGGAVVVDNSSLFRMREEVPLVIPEVNGAALAGHRGIVANPNCSTMQMLMALAPIEAAVGIERLVVATYQSVSGTGQRAVEELLEQSRAVVAGEPIAPPEVYPHQIAFNVLPQVETFKDGDPYTTEERKIMGETRKILGRGEDLRISTTCARVPVLQGHSQAVNVETRAPLSAEDCRALLAETPGLIVLDDPSDGIYPLAVEAAGRDEVLVGRIRGDPSHERALNLWVVGDNLRKGAALNAVQIAEELVARGLLGSRAASV